MHEVWQMDGKAESSTKQRKKSWCYPGTWEPCRSLDEGRRSLTSFLISRYHYPFKQKICSYILKAPKSKYIGFLKDKEASTSRIPSLSRASCFSIELQNPSFSLALYFSVFSSFWGCKKWWTPYYMMAVLGHRKWASDPAPDEESSGLHIRGLVFWLPP